MYSKVGFLVALSLAIIVVMPASAEIVLSIDPDNTTVGVGDSFSINVYISDVEDLFSVNLDVLFDTSIMDYVGYTPGDFLRSSGAQTFSFLWGVDEPAGLVGPYEESILIVTTGGISNGVSGDGVLLALDFVATNVGQGLIQVQDSSLLLGTASTSPIRYDTTPGTVTVVAAPEPASMAILGCIAGGAFLIRRKKRK